MENNYSQNDEQNYILDYFKDIDNGVYIEIGAFDAFTFSNTRALFEKGWSGTLVEPSPICFQNLKSIYENEPRITLIEAAIASNTGTMTFYNSGLFAVSTSDLDHKVKWESSASFTPITVNTIGMLAFLEQYGAECDFINIDVEGTNYELFSLLPDVFLNRLKMICIEHDNMYIEIEEKLDQFGFKKIAFNHENLIMVK